MKESLLKSKSMWGFGLAILFYFGRKLLVANGVVLPEGEWDWIIMFVNGVLLAYGVYGFRDAIRKAGGIVPKTNPHISTDYNDNLGKLEQEYQDKQYQENERVTFSDKSIRNYRKDTKIIAECSQTGGPTFCLRAQDALAIDTISHYFDLAKHHDCDPAFVAELSVIYDRFLAWRDANSKQMKIPD
ncbi:MAG TPA: hypothetical protein PK605_00430 [Ignavibacteria bacterium]|nr:hypothetical protein [Bacteroidota bacterium]HRE10754.1 hypothetical protein [Ignavibacteria bacterium]HRF66005.1 hypothetical protein [Ignavibacteria bacterium]HRJ02845.1 hypothetical protein [Ignavibacteria bacterium]HRJ84403.1 hypothetical protein [Ignavibacteria bacterium]